MIAALAAVLVIATGSTGACDVPPPQAPAVPAPIVFKTSCGGFLLTRDGRVTRLPLRWFAAHAGGTGRGYGADLQVRRNRAGRFWLLRRGRVVWRSSGLYPRTGDTVAFGPGAFAFNDYYRGVYLTDLKRSERLVVHGRGRSPFDFFGSGRLIVTGGPAITVLSAEGRIERRYRYQRSRGGLAFDRKSNTLFFVTRDRRLATVRETRLRVGRRLRFDGFISLTEARPLMFSGARSLTLATRDGRLIARAQWPRQRIEVVDSGWTVSADGRHVAFRLSDAKPGATTGTAVLYVLHAGQVRAEPVYRHRLGRQGCGGGAMMRWNGRNLLYSSADGQVAIIKANGGRLDLSRFLRALPRRAPSEQPVVAWRADYPS